MSQNNIYPYIFFQIRRIFQPYPPYSFTHIILKDIFNIQSNNQIGDEFVSKLGQALQQCLYLSSISLDFDEINISQHNTQYFGVLISCCNNLTVLDLNLCRTNISSQGAQDLWTALSRCSQLTNLHLNLGNNCFENQAFHAISQGLESCQNLKNLVLNLEGIYNFSRDSASQLGIGLSKCSNLSILRIILMRNGIGFKGLSLLIQALKHCSKLYDIEIWSRDNEVYQKGKKEILKQLQKFKKLVKLLVFVYDSF
ncbi:hypothetical protein ABPG74_013020 [Tetrahymena malaccensis]